MNESVLMWLIGGFATVLITVIWYAIKQFISGINEKFNVLFDKVEKILDRLAQLADDDDLKHLERRVRKLEDKTNSCVYCNGKKID